MTKQKTYSIMNGTHHDTENTNVITHEQFDFLSNAFFFLHVPSFLASQPDLTGDIIAEILFLLLGQIVSWKTNINEHARLTLNNTSVQNDLQLSFSSLTIFFKRYITSLQMLDGLIIAFQF